MAQTQPGYAPAPAPKRHRVRNGLLGCGGLVVLVIIVIAVIAAVASSGGSSGSGAGGGGTSASNGGGTKTATLGTPVRDGKFRFTVTAVTHAKNIGGQFGETAQGRFTVLHVTVKNIGNVAQNMDASSQFVYDASGKQYSANSAASSTSFFLNDINPGNEVTGRIAFDLPKGVKAVKAELHDSPFSDGVTVTLP